MPGILSIAVPFISGAIVDDSSSAIPGLSVDSNGDLIMTATVGPNAGKSVNLTSGYLGTQSVIVPAPNPSAPVLDSISPATIPAGSPDTVITFAGSGFSSNMNPGFGDHLMSWTTQMINPVFVSSSEFQGTLGANLLVNPTSFFLFLINPNAPDSNNLQFSVT